MEQRTLGGMFRAIDSVFMWKVKNSVLLHGDSEGISLQIVTIRAGRGWNIRCLLLRLQVMFQIAGATLWLRFSNF